MKRKSAESVLDVSRSLAHRGYVMEKPSKSPIPDREAKLAEALRKNLRRRKAGGNARPGEPSKDESGAEVIGEGD